MKKILFFLFAAVLAAGGVEAQEAVDSMKIFYRRGYRNVDLSFRDNRAQMERFLNLTEAALKNDRVEKVVIRSYASPDGTAEANERLSVGRAEELKAYLVREGNIPASLIEYHAEGIAWGMLREQVAASDMAGRDEVLDILDHTPLWIYDDDNRIVDGRKKQLMDLQGGKPYNYMLEHFFPELRNSVMKDSAMAIAIIGRVSIIFPMIFNLSDIPSSKPHLFLTLTEKKVFLSSFPKRKQSKSGAEHSLRKNPSISFPTGSFAAVSERK